MKTFKHSGKCGDIIFSLPTIEIMGGGILYIPEHSPIGQNIYSNMKPLLEKLPYIYEVRELESMLPVGAKVEGIKVDLDKHLEHPWRGRTNMVQRYFDVFGLKGDWKKPWMDLGLTADKGYSVINVTPRHRDNSRLDWGKVYSRIPRPVFHIGTHGEYKAFEANIGDVQRIECSSAYEVAAIVAGAKAVYCNQSLVLTLAQAMGKEYHCEFKPGKLNCRFHTPNEHAL